VDEFSTASIGEEHIEVSLLLLNRGEQAIEVFHLGGIALNTRDVFTDLFDGGIKFSLATTVMKTYAPSATKRLAVARPMPLVPPVTRATFPSSFFIMMNPMVVEGGRVVCNY
jgi:hypothetical protein